MLVLTRRVEERIYIGDDIIITVVKINGARVKIGIEAPDYINIAREELCEPEPTERPRKSGDRTGDRGSGEAADC